VVLNKADRVDPREPPAVGVVRRDDLHVLRASALTGAGIEELRAAIAEVLGDLWNEVDLAVPYTQGELLARVRERGTVAFDYRDEDVRITGKVPPAIAGELQAVAHSWARARKTRDSESGDDEGGVEMSDELLTAGKIAEKLGVSPAKVSKAIKDNTIEPDQKKGNCAYFGAEKVAQLEELLKK
jgi:hypothetical protein